MPRCALTRRRREKELAMQEVKLHQETIPAVPPIEYPEIRVPVKLMLLDENATRPQYAHDGDACFDVFACLKEPVEMLPGDITAIPTGIAMQAPPGWHFQMESRSGLARKHGISVCGGVMDNGYTGEWTVILVNEGRFSYVVEPGEKIAQVKLERSYVAQIKNLLEFEPTSRGDKGFGSTGKGLLQ